MKVLRLGWCLGKAVKALKCQYPRFLKTEHVSNRADVEGRDGKQL